MPIQHHPNKHLLHYKTPDVTQVDVEDRKSSPDIFENGLYEPGYHMDNEGNIEILEVSLITNPQPTPSFWLKTENDKYIKFYYIRNTQEFMWEKGNEITELPKNSEVIGNITDSGSIEFEDMASLRNVIRNGISTYDK